MLRRVILAAMVLLACGTARAEPPIAAFAPAQLRLAEDVLQRAEEALAQRDYELARRLAAQAGLDARLAYGMTDSAFLRRDAARVHERSARLRWLSLQRNGIPVSAQR
ncbi:MAG TPA: DUF4398 domain-containing protein [Burkholderiales bacterium]